MFIMKALQPEILMNERGKFIPFIFIEWVFFLPSYLPNNTNCPQYKEWVQLFSKGGYQPANPGNIWEKTDLETVEKENWQDLVWIHNTVKLG